MDNMQACVGETMPGQSFHFNGQDWIGFDSTTMPEDLKNVSNWRFLRADGASFDHESTAMARSALWGRDRIHPQRVVGYWHEGAKKVASAFVKPETFKFLGSTWTRCKNDKMPAELIGVDASGWQYLTEADITTRRLGIATSPGDDSKYWDGHPHGIVAYRLLGKEPVQDKPPGVKSVTPKHQSPSEIRYHAKEAERVANLAMIAADGIPETAAEKHDRLVKEMVGNGNIFAPPKREVPNLFRVAPMTNTGFSLWGAEHLGE